MGMLDACRNQQFYGKVVYFELFTKMKKTGRVFTGKLGTDAIKISEKLICLLSFSSNYPFLTHVIKFEVGYLI